MKYDTKNSYGKRMVKEAKIKEIGQGGGATYTGGDGIKVDNTNMEISVKSTVAMKRDLEDYELKSEAFSGDYDDLTNKPTIPDEVSGTNDGTNWTSLTIGEDTYDIPQGGGGTKTELVLGYKPDTALRISGLTIAQLIAAGAPVFNGNTIVVSGVTVYNNTTDADTTDVYFDGFFVMQGSNSTTDGIVLGNFNSINDYNNNTFRSRIKLLAMTSSNFTLRGYMRFQISPYESGRNDYVYGVTSQGNEAYRIVFQNNRESFAIPYVVSQTIPTYESGDKVPSNITEPSLYARLSIFPSLQQAGSVFFLGNEVNVEGKGYMEWKQFVNYDMIQSIPAVDTTTDGTYVLKATVADGVVSYEWVAEE